MSDTSWDILNESIVAGDDRTWTFTFDEDGTPTDVSAWNYYFKATAPWTTDEVTILPAAMVKSDSGTGTTDSITIPFTSTDTAVAPGFYDLQITNEDGSSNVNTFFKGTLTITEDIEDGI